MSASRRESIRILWAVVADLGLQADRARDGVTAAQGEIATTKLILELFEREIRKAEKKLQRLQSLNLNLGPNTVNQLLNFEAVIAEQIELISGISSAPEALAKISLVVQASAGRVNDEIRIVQRFFSLVVKVERHSLGGSPAL